MIVTKNWLNEFVNLNDISLNELVKTLNSIGLEVDSVRELKAPEKIVVGFVKSCKKHENSDHLNVCEVDIGAELLQIVCGAKNVAAGQFVAVALIGAMMPNGLEIKKTKLRGVDSCGMICSSSELDFARINDGIMILDESIGELELGRELKTYPAFNDVLIEIELTPNRGDCLSVYGIARDLSAVLNLELKKPENYEDDKNAPGIGNLLKFESCKDLKSTLGFRLIELKEKLNINLLISLRLALVELLNTNSMQNLLNYATHSSGVLLNAYDFEKICPKCNELHFMLKKEENEESKISVNDEILSVCGIYQNPKFACDENSKNIVLEASFSPPDTIAKAKNSYKNKDEKTLYRSFRGSEPELKFGLDIALVILKNSNALIYNFAQQFLNKEERPVLNINFAEINSMIGQNIDKKNVLKILENLGFELVSFNEFGFNVKIPIFRSDIKNKADICEEIVRIVGIDNIASKPLKFSEKSRFNETFKAYKELKKLRARAVENGYFESLHYVLDNSEELCDFPFAQTSLKLVNPITAELNSLRTTLLNHLINAAALNAKNSKKLIKLFEVGSVFDTQNTEKSRFALIHSGLKEEPKIANKAKPEFVRFYDFLAELQNIFGEFELRASNYDFLSPYEQAEIYKNGQKLGFVGRLNLRLENARELMKSYVCEVDLNLLKSEKKVAKAYSKFPGISRDLSILVAKNYDYKLIQNAIKSLNLDILDSFKIVDLYNDENLGENYSLTISFQFRDLSKTLEDAQVNSCMEQILSAINSLGLSLR